MGSIEIERKSVVEAARIFLLMKRGFPISRNVRAQWILDHLDTIITIDKPTLERDETPELEIVSIIPRNCPPSWNEDTNHQYQYKVTTSTSVVFLAHKYRMVFCLDLSPSLGTIDIQNGEIVTDEVCSATRKCLESISKPFKIPGSNRILQPEIYVTIIVHTPFFTNPAQQVLVQGWLITTDNVSSLMKFVESRLSSLEGKIVQVTNATQQLENYEIENDGLVSRLFDEENSIDGSSTSASNGYVSVISPDASFINILRYGQLALSLLPANSCAHLVVVSDGIIGLTDVYALDSVVQKFRASTVACSFIQIGSSYHPHCANGMVPYQDVLCFLATATLGCHLTLMSQSEQTSESQINTDQEHFLCWKLYRAETCFAAHETNHWHTYNKLFYSHQQPQLLRKKQLDDKVTCTLSSLMCCRLRDGYLIKKITLRDGCVEICFILPWRSHVFLEYLVSSTWPPKSLVSCNKIQYTITAEAPYEFLHDITCLSKKPLKSQYRQSVVSRFWATVTGLTESNNMLEHFSWFPEPGWTWYNVPDTIRNGMPVFNLPASPSVSTLQFGDSSCPQFGKIWQPVASLDPNQCARWMHSQRITLVLTHDRPLPKYVHQANQSGRFQSIQCRQAAAVLYAMLKNWATFVLVENHTYVQFIYREVEKPPVSFSVIRINCKALCVTLNVTFAGGTEGVVRHNVVIDLVERLSKLTLPNRPTEQRETPCCSIIHKALEKILIRYERMPIELNSVILPDGTQQIPFKAEHLPIGIPTTTLCRYLYHNRWLWNVKKPVIHTIPGIAIPKLNINIIAGILSTITKIRLTEGFNFAYSSAGIINMVMEIEMQRFYDDFFPCVIQYIIFPPQTIPNSISEAESESDEETDGGTGDEDNESDGDHQMVTEVWIEPQCGRVKFPDHPTVSYMNSQSYYQLCNTIAQVDEECINALLTLEHLSLLSQVQSRDANIDIVNGYQHSAQCGQSNQHSHKSQRSSTPSLTQSKVFSDDLPEERFNSKFFTFDVLNILPKCQQAELLYSMFADSISKGSNTSTNSILMESLMSHMKRLHNTELVMSECDSEKFTEMLLNRPRDDGGPPLYSKDLLEDQQRVIRWRCFIQGISKTHIILTFLPATEKDVRALIHPKEKSQKYSNDDSNENQICKESDTPEKEEEKAEEEVEEKQSSSCPNGPKKLIVSPNLHMQEFESNITSCQNTAESTPKHERRRHIASDGTKSTLILPIYVYDCSLSLLIDVLVSKFLFPRSKDIYQNNTFTVGNHISEEFINLRASNECKSSSPEPKSEESDNLMNGQRSLIRHCKFLSLAHCHCYVVAVYKSLSFQLQMSYEDMEAAVEQCEESLIEINITNYFKTVCNHLNHSMKQNDGEPPNYKCTTCSEFQPLHNLIKEKFWKVMTVAFKPVPSHPELYYFSPLQNPERLNPMEYHRSDSEDDLEEEFVFRSEPHECKMDDPIGKTNTAFNAAWPNINLHDDPKMSNYDSTESLVSEDESNQREQPLFLQLSCSVHSGPYFSSIPVKLLPTCFAEIKQRLDEYVESDISKIKITLDIICLNLPKDVLDVSPEQTPELRTSHRGSSPAGSIANGRDNSPDNHMILSDNGMVNRRLEHLPLYQHDAITSLKAEIEWLLRDEIATALLDTNPPTYETLRFVANHVAESNGRTSCHVDKVPLHFVFPSTNSSPKFFQELIKMEVDKYVIRQQEEFLYFVKNDRRTNLKTGMSRNNSDTKNDDESNENSSIKTTSNPHDDSDGVQDLNSQTSRQDSSELPGYQSEISSIGEGQPGTDDGYEGDSSNCGDDCCWLTDLDKRRGSLPNFWLILQARHKHVDVYFHCRFLEFVSLEVDGYKQVQKTVVSQIAAICRRVNQYLLLESLHDTRNCDNLLEPESHEDHGWRAESNEAGPSTMLDSRMNMTPGMFRCSVVWEETFCLHPRLKTGPGRSGLSRGIKALHVVLSRFSVNNRDNMFVYRENNSNVFYLRLHEQTSDGKTLQNKLSESDERLMVSRSNSVASLSHSRMSGHQIDPTKYDDTRPRVRSFGEKDSDYMNRCDDSIVLMVHGISEPGLEVRSQLVQVLHNRLDDAVLEVLSIMLARNPMCKLTPADVHFIQKPYRAPESYVQFSVQNFYLKHIDALAFYLRQNILQFLYIPKYTDPRAHYHLQDYSQPEDSKERVPETDIFLNNQSQSSGNRGIACIAMAINKDFRSSTEREFPTALRISDFPEVVSTYVHEGKTRSVVMPHGPIEFRIWKQGRVNLETLIEKLRAAINHAMWDLVTEYYLLQAPLNVAMPYSDDNRSEMETTISDTSSIGNLRNVEENKSHSFELEEEGQLHDVYHKTLPYWFQFALDSGVPSVKKHTLTIQHRHSIVTIVKELQALIRLNAPDTSTRVYVLRQSQPFVVDDDVPSGTYLPFREMNNSNIEDCTKDELRNVEDEDDQHVYVSCEFGVDSQKSYSKAVVIARNFNQWRASFNTMPEPELLIPKDQKLLQKFNPLIQESSFIPRQRLLLATVRGDQLVLYMYNWSKERSEKLIKQVTNLGTWLTSRSTLFSKIMMQKLGLFHHQSVELYLLQDEHGHQFCPMTDIDALSKFTSTSVGGDSKEWSRSTNSRPLARDMHCSWERMIGHVMRDAKPTMHYPPNTTDPIVKAAYDLQDLYQRDRKSKEDFTRLYTMWQSRSAAPNIPISTTNLNTFKQYSRLTHYCHTPILFLPQWRLQSAATRDHSLTPPPSTQPMSLQSGSSNTQVINNGNKRNAKPWHEELCISMISEYKQYLQLLGFNPLQIDSEHKNSNDDGQSQQICYLKKSMLGGILLFELHMIQPFFTAKLRVIECNRLQTKSSTTLVNQFMLSFVDACEKIKINMHLHSFTYDFHLRCIHSYIAGVGHWSLQQGYDLTHFLEDFTKYYSKAPNFARNLVDGDVVTVRNLTTPAHTLYSYLLSHEKTYGMQVFSVSNNAQDTNESEYVLVRLQSTPLVSYCDAQDTKYTDDFTIALIVSKQDQPPALEKCEITLKYYLLLTSKRELYPKREVENNKLGKFRTVYSVGKATSSSHAESILDISPSATPTPSSDRSSRDETNTDFEFSENNSSVTGFVKQDSTIIEDEKQINEILAPTPPPVPSSPLMTTLNTVRTSEITSPHLIQIRQESINYLGYYSSHEQLMQQLIISQARAAQQHITNMIERGMLHCRTHLLWNKLLENKSTMTYAEFMELRSLANVEPLSNLDSRLSPLINQPLIWYQTLAKVLQNKYQEHYKQFSTMDGTVVHHLILHPSYLQAFMMLTVDMHTSRGELCAVYRKTAEMPSTPFSVNEIHCLIEGFINACCFHLWMGLYS